MIIEESEKTAIHQFEGYLTAKIFNKQAKLKRLISNQDSVSQRKLAGWF
jgi:hypothetical protein